jgi:hypothetical protein
LKEVGNSQLCPLLETEWWVLFQGRAIPPTVLELMGCLLLPGPVRSGGRTDLKKYWRSSPSIWKEGDFHQPAVPFKRRRLLIIEE